MTRPPIPWLRVVAEGAVIVVSILMAFGIDATWDYRSERREEVELLTGIRNEFERLGLQARTEADITEAGRTNAVRALEMTAGQLAGLDPDTATLILIVPIHRSFVNELPFAALRSAFSSGRLALLRSNELRTTLSEVQKRDEDLDEFRGLLTTLSVQAAVAARRHPGMDSAVDADVAPGRAAVEAVRADREVIGHLSTKVYFWGPYARNLRRLATALDDAVSQIDAELGR